MKFHKTIKILSLPLLGAGVASVIAPLVLANTQDTKNNTKPSESNEIVFTHNLDATSKVYQNHHLSLSIDAKYHGDQLDSLTYQWYYQIPNDPTLGSVGTQWHPWGEFSSNVIDFSPKEINNLNGYKFKCVVSVKKGTIPEQSAKVITATSNITTIEVLSPTFNVAPLQSVAYPAANLDNGTMLEVYSYSLLPGSDQNNYTYQWYRSTPTLSTGKWTKDISKVENATSPYLYLKDTQLCNNGIEYYCEVTNKATGEKEWNEVPISLNSTKDYFVSTPTTTNTQILTNNLSNVTVKYSTPKLKMNDLEGANFEYQVYQEDQTTGKLKLVPSQSLDANTVSINQADSNAVYRIQVTYGLNLLTPASYQGKPVERLVYAEALSNPFTVIKTNGSGEKPTPQPEPTPSVSTVNVDAKAMVNGVKGINKQTVGSFKQQLDLTTGYVNNKDLLAVAKMLGISTPDAVQDIQFTAPKKENQVVNGYDAVNVTITLDNNHVWNDNTITTVPNATLNGNKTVLTVKGLVTGLLAKDYPPQQPSANSITVQPKAVTDFVGKITKANAEEFKRNLNLDGSVKTDLLTKFAGFFGINNPNAISEIKFAAGSQKVNDYKTVKISIQLKAGFSWNAEATAGFTSANLSSNHQLLTIDNIPTGIKAEDAGTPSTPSNQVNIDVEKFIKTIKEINPTSYDQFKRTLNKDGKVLPAFVNAFASKLGIDNTEDLSSVYIDHAQNATSEVDGQEYDNICVRIVLKDGCIWNSNLVKQFGSQYIPSINGTVFTVDNLTTGLLSDQYPPEDGTVSIDVSKTKSAVSHWNWDMNSGTLFSVITGKLAIDQDVDITHMLDQNGNIKPEYLNQITQELGIKNGKAVINIHVAKGDVVDGKQTVTLTLTLRPHWIWDKRILNQYPDCSLDGDNKLIIRNLLTDHISSQVPPAATKETYIDENLLEKAIKSINPSTVANFKKHVDLKTGLVNSKDVLTMAGELGLNYPGAVASIRFAAASQTNINGFTGIRVIFTLKPGYSWMPNIISKLTHSSMIENGALCINNLETGLNYLNFPPAVQTVSINANTVKQVISDLDASDINKLRTVMDGLGNIVQNHLIQMSENLGISNPYGVANIKFAPGSQPYNGKKTVKLIITLNNDYAWKQDIVNNFTSATVNNNQLIIDNLPSAVNDDTLPPTKTAINVDPVVLKQAIANINKENLNAFLASIDQTTGNVYAKDLFAMAQKLGFNYPSAIGNIQFTYPTQLTVGDYDAVKVVISLKDDYQWDASLKDLVNSDNQLIFDNVVTGLLSKEFHPSYAPIGVNGDTLKTFVHHITTYNLNDFKSYWAPDGNVLPNYLKQLAIWLGVNNPDAIANIHVSAGSVPVIHGWFTIKFNFSIKPGYSWAKDLPAGVNASLVNNQLVVDNLTTGVDYVDPPKDGTVIDIDPNQLINGIKGINSKTVADFKNHIDLQTGLVNQDNPAIQFSIAQLLGINWPSAIGKIWFTYATNSIINGHDAIGVKFELLPNHQFTWNPKLVEMLKNATISGDILKVDDLETGLLASEFPPQLIPVSVNDDTLKTVIGQINADHIDPISKALDSEGNIKEAELSNIAQILGITPPNSVAKITVTKTAEVIDGKETVQVSIQLKNNYTWSSETAQQTGGVIKDHTLIIDHLKTSIISSQVPPTTQSVDVNASVFNNAIAAINADTVNDFKNSINLQTGLVNGDHLLDWANKLGVSYPGAVASIQFAYPSDITTDGFDNLKVIIQLKDGCTWNKDVLDRLAHASFGANNKLIVDNVKTGLSSKDFVTATQEVNVNANTLYNTFNQITEANVNEFKTAFGKGGVVLPDYLNKIATELGINKPNAVGSIVVSPATADVYQGKKAAKVTISLKPEYYAWAKDLANQFVFGNVDGLILTVDNIPTGIADTSTPTQGTAVNVNQNTLNSAIKNITSETLNGFWDSIDQQTGNVKADDLYETALKLGVDQPATIANIQFTYPSDSVINGYDAVKVIFTLKEGYTWKVTFGDVKGLTLTVDNLETGLKPADHTPITKPLTINGNTLVNAIKGINDDNINDLNKVLTKGNVDAQYLKQVAEKLGINNPNAVASINFAAGSQPVLDGAYTYKVTIGLKDGYRWGKNAVVGNIYNPVTVNGNSLSVDNLISGRDYKLLPPAGTEIGINPIQLTSAIKNITSANVDQLLKYIDHNTGRVDPDVVFTVAQKLGINWPSAISNIYFIAPTSPTVNGMDAIGLRFELINGKNYQWTNESDALLHNSQVVDNALIIDNLETGLSPDKYPPRIVYINIDANDLKAAVAGINEDYTDALSKMFDADGKVKPEDLLAAAKLLGINYSDQVQAISIDSGSQVVNGNVSAKLTITLKPYHKWTASLKKQLNANINGTTIVIDNLETNIISTELPPEGTDVQVNTQTFNNTIKGITPETVNQFRQTIDNVTGMVKPEYLSGWARKLGVQYPGAVKAIQFGYPTTATTNGMDNLKVTLTLKPNYEWDPNILDDTSVKANIALPNLVMDDVATSLPATDFPSEVQIVNVNSQTLYQAFKGINNEEQVIKFKKAILANGYAQAGSLVGFAKAFGLSNPYAVQSIRFLPASIPNYLGYGCAKIVIVLKSDHFAWAEKIASQFTTATLDGLTLTIDNVPSGMVSHQEPIPGTKVGVNKDQLIQAIKAINADNLDAFLEQINQETGYVNSNNIFAWAQKLGFDIPNAIAKIQFTYPSDPTIDNYDAVKLVVTLKTGCSWADNLDIGTVNQLVLSIDNLQTGILASEHEPQVQNINVDGNVLTQAINAINNQNQAEFNKVLDQNGNVLSQYLKVVAEKLGVNHPNGIAKINVTNGTIPVVNGRDTYKVSFTLKPDYKWIDNITTQFKQATVQGKTLIVDDLITSVNNTNLPPEQSQITVDPSQLTNAMKNINANNLAEFKDCFDPKTGVVNAKDLFTVAQKLGLNLPAAVSSITFTYPTHAVIDGKDAIAIVINLLPNHGYAWAQDLTQKLAHATINDLTLKVDDLVTGLSAEQNPPLYRKVTINVADVKQAAREINGHHTDPFSSLFNNKGDIIPSNIERAAEILGISNPHAIANITLIEGAPNINGRVTVNIAITLKPNYQWSDVVGGQIQGQTLTFTNLPTGVTTTQLPPTSDGVVLNVARFKKFFKDINADNLQSFVNKISVFTGRVVETSVADFAADMGIDYPATVASIQFTYPSEMVSNGFDNLKAIITLKSGYHWAIAEGLDNAVISGDNNNVLTIDNIATSIDHTQAEPTTQKVSVNPMTFYGALKGLTDQNVSQFRQCFDKEGNVLPEYLVKIANALGVSTPTSLANIHFTKATEPSQYGYANIKISFTLKAQYYGWTKDIASQFNDAIVKDLTLTIDNVPTGVVDHTVPPVGTVIKVDKDTFTRGIKGINSETVEKFKGALDLNTGFVHDNAVFGMAQGLGISQPEAVAKIQFTYPLFPESHGYDTVSLKITLKEGYSWAPTSWARVENLTLSIDSVETGLSSSEYPSVTKTVELDATRILNYFKEMTPSVYSNLESYLEPDGRVNANDLGIVAGLLGISDANAIEAITITEATTPVYNGYMMFKVSFTIKQNYSWKKGVLDNLPHSSLNGKTLIVDDLRTQVEYPDLPPAGSKLELYPEQFKNYIKQLITKDNLPEFEKIVDAGTGYVKEGNIVETAKKMGLNYPSAIKAIQFTYPTQDVVNGYDAVKVIFTAEPGYHYTWDKDLIQSLGAEINDNQLIIDNVPTGINSQEVAPQHKPLIINKEALHQAVGGLNKDHTDAFGKLLNTQGAVDADNLTQAAKLLGISNPDAVISIKVSAGSAPVDGMATVKLEIGLNDQYIWNKTEVTGLGGIVNNTNNFVTFDNLKTSVISTELPPQTTHINLDTKALKQAIAAINSNTLSQFENSIDMTNGMVKPNNILAYAQKLGVSYPGTVASIQFTYPKDMVNDDNGYDNAKVIITLKGGYTWDKTILSNIRWASLTNDGNVLNLDDLTTGLDSKVNAPQTETIRVNASAIYNGMRNLTPDKLNDFKRAIYANGKALPETIVEMARRLGFSDPHALAELRFAKATVPNYGGFGAIKISATLKPQYYAWAKGVVDQFKDASLNGLTLVIDNVQTGIPNHAEPQEGAVISINTDNVIQWAHNINKDNVADLLKMIDVNSGYVQADQVFALAQSFGVDQPGAIAKIRLTYPTNPTTGNLDNIKIILTLKADKKYSWAQNDQGTVQGLDFVMDNLVTGLNSTQYPPETANVGLDVKTLMFDMDHFWKDQWDKLFSNLQSDGNVKLDDIVPVAKWLGISNPNAIANIWFGQASTMTILGYHALQVKLTLKDNFAWNPDVTKGLQHATLDNKTLSIDDLATKYANTEMPPEATLIELNPEDFLNAFKKNLAPDTLQTFYRDLAGKDGYLKDDANWFWGAGFGMNYPATINTIQFSYPTVPVIAGYDTVKVTINLKNYYGYKWGSSIQKLLKMTSGINLWSDLVLTMDNVPTGLLAKDYPPKLIPTQLNKQSLVNAIKTINTAHNDLLSHNLLPNGNFDMGAQDIDKILTWMGINYPDHIKMLNIVPDPQPTDGMETVKITFTLKDQYDWADDTVQVTEGTISGKQLVIDHLMTSAVWSGKPSSETQKIRIDGSKVNSYIKQILAPDTLKDFIPSVNFGTGLVDERHLLDYAYGMGVSYPGVVKSIQFTYPTDPYNSKGMDNVKVILTLANGYTWDSNTGLVTGNVSAEGHVISFDNVATSLDKNAYPPRLRGASLNIENLRHNFRNVHEDLQPQIRAVINRNGVVESKYLHAFLTKIGLDEKYISQVAQAKIWYANPPQQDYNTFYAFDITLTLINGNHWDPSLPFNDAHPANPLYGGITEINGQTLVIKNIISGINARFNDPMDSAVISVNKDTFVKGIKNLTDKNVTQFCYAIDLTNSVDGYVKNVYLYQVAERLGVNFPRAVASIQFTWGSTAPYYNTKTGNDTIAFYIKILSNKDYSWAPNQESSDPKVSITSDNRYFADDLETGLNHEKYPPMQFTVDINPDQLKKFVDKIAHISNWPGVLGDGEEDNVRRDEPNGSR